MPEAKTDKVSTPRHSAFRLFFEGTGIGLALVRKAVERMNGAVGVVSDGTAGSRFWIELPVPQSP